MDHHQPIVGTEPKTARSGRAPAALPSPSLTWHWPDEAATQAFARALAAQPGLGRLCITLHGDLGAGKTTLARHLLQALGVQGRIKSPTYAIVESYETVHFPVWHFDFYRFNDPQEWEDAGFRDLFASSGLKLVEWPQKAQDLMPAPDLDIAIAIGAQGQRRVQLQAHSALGAALLQGLQHAAAGLGA